MAYPTGANLNNLLLQQLSFRTGGNYPISSLYTLYANGQGQTYWSNSVNPDSLSTLSSAVGNAILSTYVELSTLIHDIGGSTIVAELSTFEHYTYSSISTLFYYQNILLAQSTNLNYAFLSTANSFQIQLDSYYQSTLNATNSTVSALVGFSSFYQLISTQNSSFAYALSSMSTGIGLQDAITSTLLINYINTGLYSTSQWTYAQISSLTSTSATKTQLGAVSTSINYALLSTSTGLSTEINNLNDDIALNSTFINYSLLSTSDNLLTTIDTLSGELSYLSTGLISLSGEVSSYQYYNLSTISSLSLQVSTLTSLTNTNTAELFSLNQQVSVITTSSILEGIYSTFIQLEAYTVELFYALELSTMLFLESTNTAYVEFSQSSISGLEVQLTSTFDSYISTLISTTNQSIYTLSGEISTTAAGASAIVSSINGVQLIQLNSSNFTGSLDFTNYRNFIVQVNDIVDLANSTYSVSFDPTTLGNIALQQGVIMLDISTNTQDYTQNNNKLALNLNSWNTINTPTYTIFPMLANSAYKMEYIYSVYNNSVYTSLVNIWPYQNTSNLIVSSIDSNLAIDPTNINIYSTGTVLEIDWDMYLFSTFVTGFSSFVNVDVDISGVLIQTFGPYSYKQSTIQIAMPDGGYAPGTPDAPAVFKSYVVGEPANASIVNGFAAYP
uniref:Uncharacterized protein n=1 Tax=viral metagenome TaxID=1070528 RepID=A0A6C0LNW8_9ZZZZ